MLLVVVVVFLPVFTGFLELSTPVYRVSPTCYLLVSPVRRTRTQFVELKIFGIGMWQNEKFPRLFVSVSITTVFGGMSTESTRIFNRVHSLSLSLGKHFEHGPRVSPGWLVEITLECRDAYRCCFVSLPSFPIT